MIATDPSLKEIFPKPPMVAYKRPPTIGDKLIRSKVPKLMNRRSQRQIKGMKKCLNCVNCPYVIEGKVVKSFASKAVVPINVAASCKKTKKTK